jgi:hypothetical protein
MDRPTDNSYSAACATNSTTPQHHDHLDRDHLHIAGSHALQMILEASGTNPPCRGSVACSLMRRMVERNRTTESSARRAYQRLAAADDPLADPTSGYPGETPSLLKKAAELASDHGAGVPALAEALKFSAAQVRDLLGDVDQCPILQIVGSED